MRTPTLLSSIVLALSTTISAIPDSSNSCPFERTVLAERDFHDHLQLDRRQSNGCAANQQSCASLSGAGASSACCPANALCTLDNAGNVACCPAGAFCTGTITSLPTTQPISTSTATSTGIATGIITTPAITGALPTYTPGQYISNAYFPFPVLWLSNAQFADASLCAAAYTTCDAYYNSCTAALQTGITGYGVTVSAPGGGYTVAGGGVATVLGLASATSVCRSLSAIGCPGQSATCGGSAGTATQTGFVIVTPSSGEEKSRSIRGGSAAALVAIVAWAIVAW